MLTDRLPIRAWLKMVGLLTAGAMSLDEAYALLKSRRPIVEDRRRWLGIYNR